MCIGHFCFPRGLSFHDLFALHISPVVAGQVLGHVSVDEEMVSGRRRMAQATPL